MERDLPSLDLLVDSAVAMLAASVRTSVAEPQRRAALRDELEWWWQVAARDLEYARSYHQHMPVPGARDEDYLDQWLAVSADLRVLAGPRFRGRDPEMPFVGVAGASRALVAADLPALRRMAADRFALFSPRYLQLWAGIPAGAWPGTTADTRLLAGPLGKLRARTVPDLLAVRTLDDLSFYDRYLAMYDEHRQLRPDHAAQARPQSVQYYADLIAAGTAWEVLVHRQPAGFMAAIAGSRGGVRGAYIGELVLAPQFCGHGYGEHLSVILAHNMPQPDDQFLLGTIHIDNHSAYRSALAAGRSDIGGEVITPL